MDQGIGEIVQELRVEPVGSVLLEVIFRCRELVTREFPNERKSDSPQVVVM